MGLRLLQENPASKAEDERRNSKTLRLCYHDCLFIVNNLYAHFDFLGFAQVYGFDKALRQGDGVGFVSFATFLIGTDFQFNPHYSPHALLFTNEFKNVFHEKFDVEFERNSYKYIQHRILYRR